MKTEAATPIDELVEARLATGRYRSREDVLLKALRQLAFHEELLADLEAAAEDEAAGRLRDADEVMAEMAEKFQLVNQP
ncbi:MAG: type II toxin-antitoxin system ParD family antitoxin [Planctomycetaceae bacterium]|nr:type II toxin-antitoxin system ParD family antitoxin [Planctomycetaceae bacterium]